MAEACLLSIEGVLSKEGPPNGQPDTTALRLFHGLKHMFKIVLSTTCSDPDWVDHWMNVVGVTDTHYLMGDDEDPYLTRMGHFEEARRLGYVFGIVVDSDPAVCAEIIRRGVVAVLWSHPRFARPEARPDYDKPMRSWDEITEEINKVKRLGPKIPVDAEMHES